MITAPLSVAPSGHMSLYVCDGGGALTSHGRGHLGYVG